MQEILVVDDSLLARNATKKILESIGYNTIIAKDGEEALKILNTKTPSCMILDLLMPKIGGIEVLESIKKQNLNIPIIILTADIQESVKNRCFELGAVEFLNKPIKKEILESSLNKLFNINI